MGVICILFGNPTDSNTSALIVQFQSAVISDEPATDYDENIIKQTDVMVQDAAQNIEPALFGAIRTEVPPEVMFLCDVFEADVNEINILVEKIEMLSATIVEKYIRGKHSNISHDAATHLSAEISGLKSQMMKEASGVQARLDRLSKTNSSFENRYSKYSFLWNIRRSSVRGLSKRLAGSIGRVNDAPFYTPERRSILCLISIVMICAAIIIYVYRCQLFSFQSCSGNDVGTFVANASASTSDGARNDSIMTATGVNGKGTFPIPYEEPATFDLLSGGYYHEKAINQ